MLHTIKSKGWDKNTAWCVPTAISILTGVPLIHSHSRAAFIRNEKLKDVQGVFASEALLMLREQGYVSIQVDLKDSYDTAPKLSKFMVDRTPYQRCMPMMIQVEKYGDFCHMVVAHYDYLADNWTMKPVEKENFPHNNAYVTAAWVIETRDNIGT